MRAKFLKLFGGPLRIGKGVPSVSLTSRYIEQMASLWSSQKFQPGISSVPIRFITLKEAFADVLDLTLTTMIIVPAIETALSLASCTLRCSPRDVI